MNRRALIMFSLCLICIITGIIVGSFFKWDKGSGAFVGAIAGFVLFALISWLVSLRDKGLWSEPNRWLRPGIGADERGVDAVAKKMQTALQQEALRNNPNRFRGPNY